LPDARLWRQLSGLGEVGDFVPVLDPLRVDGLKRLCRLQQGEVVIIPLADLILVVLIEQLGQAFAITHRLTGNGKAQILRRFVLDFVDLTNAEADAS